MMLAPLVCFCFPFKTWEQIKWGCCFMAHCGLILNPLAFEKLVWQLKIIRLSRRISGMPQIQFQHWQKNICQRENNVETQFVFGIVINFLVIKHTIILCLFFLQGARMRRVYIKQLLGKVLIVLVEIFFILIYSFNCNKRNCRYLLYFSLISHSQIWQCYILAYISLLLEELIHPYPFACRWCR